MSLAGLSASFSDQAGEAMAAYHQALCEGTQVAWARFIYAASDIAHHGEQIEALLGLQDRERAAWRIFRQIADENADLLDLQPALASA